MSVAVAKRPVEQFETQVPMPDWQLSPEEEMSGDEPIDANGMQPMVDENGMPLPTQQSPDDQGYPAPQPMIRPDGTGEPTQQELDQAFPPQQRQPGYPPPRQPPYPPRQPPYPPGRQPQTSPPRQQQPSTPPADTSQPRPYTS